MYGQLYDSMLLWYERWRVASAYRDFYALTSLTLMALLNLTSLVVLGAHWRFAWAQWLLAEAKSQPPSPCWDWACCVRMGGIPVGAGALTVPPLCPRRLPGLPELT